MCLVLLLHTAPRLVILHDVIGVKNVFTEYELHCVCAALHSPVPAGRVGAMSLFCHAVFHECNYIKTFILLHGL